MDLEEEFYSNEYSLLFIPYSRMQLPFNINEIEIKESPMTSRFTGDFPQRHRHLQGPLSSSALDLK